MSAVRSDIIATLPAHIELICYLALEANLGDSDVRARGGNDRVDLGPHQVALDRVRSVLAGGVDWNGDDGKFVFFRFLSVLPWPEDAATNAGPLASAVGRVFDVCIAKIHRLRRLANMWVRRSSGSVLRIVAAFNKVICPPAPKAAVATSVTTGAKLPVLVVASTRPGQRRAPAPMANTGTGASAPGQELEALTDDDVTDTDADTDDAASNSDDASDDYQTDDNDCRSVFGPSEALSEDIDSDW